MRKKLEERLIAFAVAVIDICKDIQKETMGKHFSGQLIRSSSSAALNYGEAQAAESRKDFIHKVSVVQKELRESLVNLKIIEKAKMSANTNVMSSIIDENNQLISIFYRTLQTAKRNEGEID
jgi:four helix bundle protein